MTVGDYNNDGFEDIFITYWGHNVLYRNNGDGTFTDVTREAGPARRRTSGGAPAAPSSTMTAMESWTCSCRGTCEFDPKKIPAAGQFPGCNFKGVLVNCGPRGLPSGNALALSQQRRRHLYRCQCPRRNRSRRPGSYGLTAVAADFDDDGWPDIYVACDSTPSLLFLNNRDGTFKESGLEMGVALNEDGREQAGMGLGVGDFNLDGQLDLLENPFHGRYSRAIR